MKETKAES